jgi:branched-chain amino acid transport system ATP-binding protein
MNGLHPDKVCKLGMVRVAVRPLTNLSVLDNVVVGALCRTNSVKEARGSLRQLVVVRQRGQTFSRAHFRWRAQEAEVARVLATG